MTRPVVLLLASWAVGGGFLFWLMFVDPIRRHSQFCEATHTELMSLVKKRPANLTREQWHHIVVWTLNGHGNILTFKRDIPQAERNRFVSELRERLARPQVDLTTIDWIWDEYESLAPAYGPVWSGRYRPTSPERLREFQEEGLPLLGIVEVD